MVAVQEGWTLGLTLAGKIAATKMNLDALAIPDRRQRHRYGCGPFARHIMPQLPDEPGIYVWGRQGKLLYVGQTRGT